MGSIKEQAQAYMPPQTKNIAELEYVDINTDMVVEEHTNSKGEDFTVNVATIEGNKYRVPNSVLEALKGIIEKFPDTKYFCVSKSGTGMSTKYQVLPHQGPVKTEQVK